LAGISAPHFGQSLGALIIAKESLTRSLSFLLRKMLSEVMPGPQQFNREAYPSDNQAGLMAAITAEPGSAKRDKSAAETRLRCGMW
jgi:hypothetical protein